jgi:hypothetical protein
MQLQSPELQDRGRLTEHLGSARNDNAVGLLNFQVGILV